MAEEEKELKRLLKLLIEATGPPGFEDPVRKLVEKEVASYAEESYTDALGNFIFRKKGTNPTAPALLFMAHMDEIGMMVRFIDDNGFLQFSYLGGFFDQVTLGQRVQIHGAKGPIFGVIGTKSPHLMNSEERKKVVSREKMFIDVGAASLDDVKSLGITIGDPIMWLGPYQELSRDLFCGKALDNRVLVAMMIEAFKRANPSVPLICVASVREETGLHGAKTSTFAVDTDHPIGLGISLDIALAGDYPLVTKGESPIYLGKGPTITIAHGRQDSLQDGYIIHPGVKTFLIKLAEKHEIPYQLEIMEGGITDGTEITLARRGIPTANIGIPTRYVHSPAGVASFSDIKHGIRFLTLIAENVPAKFKRP